MRMPVMDFANRTPLQQACAHFVFGSTRAVEELCVNNIGGTNYAESFESIILGQYCKTQYTRQMIQIFSTLFSQPGAASSLRSQTVTVGKIKIIENANNNVNINVSSYEQELAQQRVEAFWMKVLSLGDFYGLEGGTKDKSIFKWKCVISEKGLEEVNVPSAFYVLAMRNDDLFQTMMVNGCSVIAEGADTMKVPSRKFFDHCAAGEVDEIEIMLIKHKAHEWLIDVTASFDGKTPLQIVDEKFGFCVLSGTQIEKKANYARIRDLLVDVHRWIFAAGAEDDNEEKKRFETRVVENEVPSDKDELRSLCFNMAVRGYKSLVERLLNKVCADANGKTERLKGLFDAYDNGKSSLFLDLIQVGGCPEILDLLFNFARKELGDGYLRKSHFSRTYGIKNTPFLVFVCLSRRISYELLTFVFDSILTVSACDADFLRKTVICKNDLYQTPFFSLCENLNSFQTADSAIASLKLFFEMFRRIADDGKDTELNIILSVSSAYQHSRDDTAFQIAAKRCAETSCSCDVLRFFGQAIRHAGFFETQHSRLGEKDREKLWQCSGIDSLFGSASYEDASTEFPAYDVIGNTKIDFSDSETMRAIFRRFDFNGDGYLGRGEILPMMMLFFEGADGEIEKMIKNNVVVDNKKQLNFQHSDFVSKKK